MKRVLIFNALIWAFVILAFAWFFKNDPNYWVYFGILVVGATLQNSLTAQAFGLNEKQTC